MESGTLNLVGVAGLRAGLEWLLEQGIRNVHSREMALWSRLRDGLAGIDKVTLHRGDGTDRRIAVLSFNIEGWVAADVGTMLDVDYDIACRTGLQCAPLVHAQIGTDKIHGTVRLSIGPFNTEDHIDATIDAVRDVAAIKKPQDTPV
jgi:selenocysteine lyase/cysteine desulfurase